MLKRNIRKIRNFRNYRIHINGTLYSRYNNNHLSNSWRINKGSVNKDGYAIYCMKRDDGKQCLVTGHKLVLEAFVGPRPPGKEARHANNIRSDNRLKNLSWSTHVRNEKDKLKYETRPIGEKHKQAVLTDQIVRYAKRLRTRFNKTWVYLGAVFKCSPVTIRLAVVGKTWKHLQSKGDSACGKSNSPKHRRNTHTR
jgi:hypothetical protein